MKTAVITAEYNPFHKGHRWQLEQVRAAGASHVAVVMSPDFTQRGTPAIFPKRLRAQAALQNGADLVLELPVCYALAGAQRFAFGAVQLAAAMGCVDLLAFGAENADLLQLRQACTALQQEEVNQNIRQLLPSGITFAKARERAVAAVYGEETALLPKAEQHPGNRVPRQLGKLPDAHIQPLALGRIWKHPRRGAGGRVCLGELSARFDTGRQVGAGAAISAAERLAAVQTSAAGWTVRRPATGRAGGAICFEKDGAKGDGAACRPVGGFGEPLYRASREACSLEQLYAAVKSKRYPLARVRRLVMNAFLQLPAQMQTLSPPYLRVLGMNERGKQILSAMKKTASLPVSTSR